MLVLTYFLLEVFDLVEIGIKTIDFVLQSVTIFLELAYLGIFGLDQFL